MFNGSSICIMNRYDLLNFHFHWRIGEFLEQILVEKHQLQSVWPYTQSIKYYPYGLHIRDISFVTDRCQYSMHIEFFTVHFQFADSDRTLFEGIFGAQLMMTYFFFLPEKYTASEWFIKFNWNTTDTNEMVLHVFGDAIAWILYTLMAIRLNENQKKTKKMFKCSFECAEEKHNLCESSDHIIFYCFFWWRILGTYFNLYF